VPKHSNTAEMVEDQQKRCGWCGEPIQPGDQTDQAGTAWCITAARISKGGRGRADRAREAILSRTLGLKVETTLKDQGG
jgi:hypothetical protein